MPIKDKRYTVVPIHRDELVVITPFKHPLAGRKEVSVRMSAQYPLLLPKLGRTRDTLETLFHERRLKPIISMELDSSELTKRFVAADVGISFIPRSNVAEDLKAKTLSALKDLGRRPAARSGAGVSERQGPEPRGPGLHRDRREAEDGRSGVQRRPHLLTFSPNVAPLLIFR